MTIGDIVKNYRTEHKISQDNFAEKSGLSKGYISMLENNTNSRNNKPIAPTLKALQKIALGMNIDTDELLKLINGKQKVSLSESIEISKSKDLRLKKIIEFYNTSDETGKEALLEQAEFIQSKHPINKSKNIEEDHSLLTSKPESKIG